MLPLLISIPSKAYHPVNLVKFLNNQPHALNLIRSFLLLLSIYIYSDFSSM